VAQTLKVKVNRPKCCGYGICAEICPEVYKLDDGGFAYVEGDGVVPEGQRELALEGLEACPEEAIFIDEDLQG
jgi:ferredoxin